jgi:hypothetical protein
MIHYSDLLNDESTRVSDLIYYLNELIAISVMI